MSAPSDPRHGTSRPAGTPSTQEIPGVVPAPASAVPPPAAVPPPVAPPPPVWPDTLADEPTPPTRPVTAADGVDGTREGSADGSADGAAQGTASTGPVDFVPGLPGAGSSAPGPRRRLRVPGRALDRSALAGVGLAALSVVLLQLGLAQDGGRLWAAVTLWSVFATAATALGLVALGARLAAPTRVSAATATRLAGAGVLALAVFWLLVVLPMVASDPGFLVTAALLSLGGALWVGPARER